jgi:hypothetical protein
VVAGQIPVYIEAKERVDAPANAVKNQNKVFEDCVQIVQAHWSARSTSSTTRSSMAATCSRGWRT